MNKYIILTTGISNMGGAEMFTYNKWKYLTTHGWDVAVYYTHNKNGQFFLKELERFKNNYIPDMIYGLSFVPKWRQKKILNRLLSGISNDDEVVVESHIYNLSQWGELIAEKTGGKNILNCLEENLVPISKSEAEYLEFKLKRHEILNASKNRLRTYFGSYYKESYEQYTHNYMRAYCSNVVTHSVKYDMDIDADYKILSIGRLDKAYVLPTFVDIKPFIEKYPYKQFRVLIIGGDPGNKVEGEIRKVFKGIPNVKLVFLGYMFPIPYNLIEDNDVAIASANSVLVPSNEGVPTIAIDIHDHLPIGIYGETTSNRFSRDGKPAVSIMELLEDALIHGVYPRRKPVLQDEKTEMEEVFGKQVEFLSIFPRDGVTYPVNNMFSMGRKMIGRLKYLLHCMGF